MKKVLMLVTLAVAISFSSCKKEEPAGGSTEPTTEEKITGQWMGEVQYTSITAPPPIGNSSDTTDMSFMNVNFMADGTYAMDSAGVQMETGNWAAPTNSTFVLDSITFDIKTLTSTQFHVGLDSTITLGPLTISTSTVLQFKK